MNQCVFLAKSRLQLFSFHNEKTLLPSGSQKHVSLRFQSSVKTLLWNDVPFLEKRRQGTVFYGCWLPYLLLLWLGEILLSDDFPAKSWKHAFYFRKLNIVNKAVVMKRKMKYVFLASLRLQLCSLYWEKYFFCHKFPVPRFTKSCFPVVSELCKDLIGYTVPFYEKTGQRRVFCECWLPYLLLPWLGDSVQSDSLPTRSGKQHVYSGKLKNLTKTVAVMKRKMNPCVFLAGLRLELSSL